MKKVKREGSLLVMVMVFCLIFTLFASLSQAAEPYVIGFQTDVTGPASSLFDPSGEGFKLYIQLLNDQGGINGHPVKLLYEDDKSVPARAGAIATKLILEDKVLVIAGLSYSTTHNPIFKLAKEHGVPVICDYSCTAPVYDPVKQDAREIFAMGLVTTPVYANAAISLVRPLVKILPKGARFAVTSVGTPGGRLMGSLAAKEATEFGFKVVYEESIPPGTIDMSPWAQKINAANPDIFLYMGGADITINLIVAVVKYGYKKAFLISDNLTPDHIGKIVEDLSQTKNDLYYPSRFLLPRPFGDQHVAEYDRMREAIKKFGSRYPLSAQLDGGWLTARVIEEAIRRVGWPCDRKALLASLEKTNLDPRGLFPGTVIFTPNDHRGPEYINMYKWDYQGKTMKPVSNWITWNAREILKLK